MMFFVKQRTGGLFHHHSGCRRSTIRSSFTILFSLLLLTQAYFSDVVRSNVIAEPTPITTHDTHIHVDLEVDDSNSSLSSSEENNALMTSLSDPLASAETDTSSSTSVFNLLDNNGEMKNSNLSVERNNHTAKGNINKENTLVRSSSSRLRLLLTSSMNGINDDLPSRAICTWSIHENFDPDRIPQKIQYARCTSDYMTSASGQVLLCMPVFYFVHVKKLIRDSNGVLVSDRCDWQRVQVACTASAAELLREEKTSEDKQPDSDRNNIPDIFPDSRLSEENNKSEGGMSRSMISTSITTRDSTKTTHSSSLIRPTTPASRQLDFGRPADFP